MSATHQEPNYMYVFYALSLLTAVEIGVVFLPISKLIIAVMLIVLALAKAALVAMYFMHLKFEKRTLGIIALTPLILCTLLIIALLPDLTAAPHKSTLKTTAEAEQVQEQSVTE
ncbi:MAG: cytochrome C oxidase subunit IV family protein [bacterium]